MFIFWEAEPPHGSHRRIKRLWNVVYICQGVSTVRCQRKAVLASFTLPAHWLAYFYICFSFILIHCFQCGVLGFISDRRKRKRSANLIQATPTSCWCFVMIIASLFRHGEDNCSSRWSWEPHRSMRSERMWNLIWPPFCLAAWDAMLADCYLRVRVQMTSFEEFAVANVLKSILMFFILSFISHNVASQIVLLAY